MLSNIFVLILLPFTFVFGEGNSINEGGYSYHKFSGPVTGDIHQILVPRGYQNGAHQREQTVDYVAKPSYNYAYGVEDPYTGNTQSHQESRDGDAVSGQYSVMEPDGSIRVVKYTADDKNGFQVKVEYVKPGQQHQQQQQHDSS